jgi:hypothetical protein
MRDLLELVGVRPGRIIAHNYAKNIPLRTVDCPSLRNAHAFLDEETTDLYKRIREQFGSRKSPKKIFVSRLGWTASYTANHRVNAE